MLPYHAGELDAQEKAGEFDEALTNARAVRPFLPPPLTAFLPTLPWILLGAEDSRGSVWATALFGEPGFVSALDERTVRIEAGLDPDDPLAAVFDTLTAAPSVPVGLLAIDPSRRFRARINGRLSRGDEGLTVAAELVYPNCMKYIQKRTLLPEALSPNGSSQHDTALNDADLALIARIDTFFVATLAPGTAPGLGADVSHRGGRPGFVETVSAQRLRFPDYRGNSMFNTFGNLEVDPRCGLLLPDLETGDLLQLSGTARVDYSPEPSPRHLGARRLVDLAVARVVRRAGASPLRSGPVEYSPFLPGV